ncbi:adenylate cyclase [Chloropicon primus]|uniref:Adenylate cyclase n=1 Tax=Chloropicon primus TaxID=1764295 RepID=A0A5B8MZN9_9CHLO|nr:adenylate cyclase [Chloropicon primus]UPR05160.1 adenylate cyclase [Chloropicon primus]|eukprot:QDZ25959.1 adenylate cyclase [Chloropicon primus]
MEPSEVQALEDLRAELELVCSPSPSPSTSSSCYGTFFALVEEELTPSNSSSGSCEWVACACEEAVGVRPPDGTRCLDILVDAGGSGFGDSGSVKLDLEVVFITLGVVVAVLVGLGVPLSWWVHRRRRARRQRMLERAEFQQLLEVSLEQLTSNNTRGQRTMDLMFPSPLAATTPRSLSEKFRSRGIVFVFTDIENSTRYSDLDQQAFREIQEVHDHVMRDALDEFSGYEIETEGDSFHCAFERATQAVLFCERVQSDLLKHDWPAEVLALPGLKGITSLLQKRHCKGKGKEEVVVWRGPRVRMGIHAAHTEAEYTMERSRITGAVQFSGQAFKLAAEVEACCSGGQILLTQSAVEKARSEASVFHMILSHLGCFSLGSEPAVHLFQAMPSRGPLSFRGYPALRLPSVSQPTINTIKAPVGDVCLVALDFRGGTKNVMDRNLLQLQLRSWIQMFGGYEVPVCHSNALKVQPWKCPVIVFKTWDVAVKFTMATQIGLLLTPSTEKMELAIGVCEGWSEGGSTSPTGSPQNDSFGSSRQASRLQTPTKMDLREGGFLKSLLFSMLRPSTGSRIDVGESVAKHPSWSLTYEGTSCSQYQGAKVCPANYLGKKHLVLFFFFSTRTGGCAMEAKYFRDFYHLFTASGAEVIGISLDGQGKQESFSSNLQLPYPLIADFPGGLHRMFSDTRLDPAYLFRRTLVIEKNGVLVDKYETALGIDGKGYPHVTRSLSSLQAFCGDLSSGLAPNIVYRGCSRAQEVARLAKGGTSVVCQPSGSDVWEVLPRHGGPARPCLVDYGLTTSGGEECSLYGVLPSCLSDRWKSREPLPGVRGGAFKAPDPTRRVAFVFTFVCGTASPQDSARCPDWVTQWSGIARETLERSGGGYECQMVGEGNFMIAFEGVHEAARWCCNAQRALSQRSSGSVSMGIASGVPAYGKPHTRTGRQDYFGQVVNLAARVAKRAKGGEVLASLDPGDLKHWPSDLQATPRGCMTFKGISKFTDTFVITSEDVEWVTEERNPGGEVFLQGGSHEIELAH